MFTTEAISVTSVSVTPATASVSKGQSLQLTANVTTTGFDNKSVTWSVDRDSTTLGVTISSSGLLKVPAGIELDSVVVTATSVYNKTVSGTANITIVSPDGK